MCVTLCLVFAHSFSQNVSYSLVELLESLNPPAAVPVGKQGRWKGAPLVQNTSNPTSANAGNLDALISPRPKKRNSKMFSKLRKKRTRSRIVRVIFVDNSRGTVQ
jgi:hypothetical protein